jgi:Protein of unknown function (DUF2961)
VEQRPGGPPKLTRTLTARAERRYYLRDERPAQETSTVNFKSRQRAAGATAFFAACMLCGSAAAQDASAITQADWLNRLIDLDRLTRPPAEGERSLVFSSFDRRSQIVADGRYAQWDAGNDKGQFLKKSADGWDVLAECSGPGAITRLLTSDLSGRIRIVLDGREAFDAPLAEFFGGSVEPLGEPLTCVLPNRGGGVCYFPIAFAKSCVVQTREFSGAYQVDCAMLPATTAVRRFSTELDEAAQKSLQTVVAALKRGLSEKQFLRGKTGTIAAQPEKPLGPKDRLSESYDKPGTLRALYVSLTDRVEPRELLALHNMLLRIWFDGARRPQVEAPLADFFGSGFERNAYRGLVMGTDTLLEMPFEHPNESWFMYCLFPMPFQRSMRIEIENRNDARKGIGVMLYMRVDLAAPAADALQFHAHYRGESPCSKFDYPVLESSGPGRYVGTVLNVIAPRAEWWGEGDHKAWIDGEAFPSIWGTSTADYFGFAPGAAASSRALGGATSLAPFGRNSAYRWHVSDDIVFHKSIKLAIENAQPGAAQDAGYASVAYWYAPGDARHFFTPLKDADLRVPDLKIPGAVEIEGSISGTDWGTELKQRDETGVEYSGRAAVRIAASQPVRAALKAPRAGRYRLQLRAVTGQSFETISVSRDGKEIGVVKYSRQARGTYDVAELDLAAGETPLQLQCSKPAVLDCWILTPVEPGK